MTRRDLRALVEGWTGLAGLTEISGAVDQEIEGLRFKGYTFTGLGMLEVEGEVVKRRTLVDFIFARRMKIEATCARSAGGVRSCL